MRKKDWLIVLAVVFFIALIPLVVQFGGVMQRSVISAKPFRAQSGAMRDHVMPILSDTQEEFADVHDEEDLQKSLGEETENDPLQITVHESVIAEAAQKALDNPIPEDGIQNIEHRLAESHDLAEESDMNQALATLCLRVLPAQTDKAEAAAKKAAETARTPEERQRAAFVNATIQQFRGNYETARKHIKEALAHDTDPTASSLRLHLLDANMAVQMGDHDGAIESYRKVMAQSGEVASVFPAAARDSYRLSALKLTRLFRNLGRDAEADELAETVKKQLFSPEKRSP